MATPTTPIQDVNFSALLARTHVHDDPKIDGLENQPISKDFSYASLILVCALLFDVFFANFLERWALAAIYGATYTDLEKNHDDRRRRSFVYHNVAAVMFTCGFCIFARPLYMFLCGPASLSTPLDDHWLATVGDALLFATQLYNGYYLFELCFRTRFASWINLAHHTGLLTITQTALVLSVDLVKQPDATMEFYMCLVWGIFDVISEIPLHWAMILWRVKRDNHRLRGHLAYGCLGWSLALSFAEIGVTGWLLSQTWSNWKREWQIITPLLFSVWMCAQFYGAYRLWEMAVRETRLWSRGQEEQQIQIPLKV